MKARDVAPDQQPHGWQLPARQPCGHLRMVPPLDLHEIGGTNQPVQLAPLRADHQSAAMGTQMVRELGPLGPFQTGHHMADAISAASRLRHHAGEHLANAPAQVGRDM